MDFVQHLAVRRVLRICAVCNGIQDVKRSQRMLVCCVLVIQVVLHLTGEPAELRENPSKKTQPVHLPNDWRRLALVA